MIDVKYIVAIVAGGLYLFLVFIGFCVYVYTKSKQRALFRKIFEMYNDEKLAKLDYDYTTYDDETARIVSVSRTEGQLTIEDILFDGSANAADEGLEEITGNYKPD